MRKGFPNLWEMRKYLTIYEEAVSHLSLCNCSILNFLIYEENFILFFISAVSMCSVPYTQSEDLDFTSRQMPISNSLLCPTQCQESQDAGTGYLVQHRESERSILGYILVAHFRGGRFMYRH
jgi:hypothetical protein